jgi:hypothetical protein
VEINAGVEVRALRTGVDDHDFGEASVALARYLLDTDRPAEALAILRAPRSHSVESVLLRAQAEWLSGDAKLAAVALLAAREQGPVPEQYVSLGRELLAHLEEPAGGRVLPARASSALGLEARGLGLEERQAFPVDSSRQSTTFASSSSVPGRRASTGTQVEQAFEWLGRGEPALAARLLEDQPDAASPVPELLEVAQAWEQLGLLRRRLGAPEGAARAMLRASACALAAGAVSVARRHCASAWFAPLDLTRPLRARFTPGRQASTVKPEGLALLVLAPLFCLVALRGFRWLSARL